MAGLVMVLAAAPANIAQAAPTARALRPRVIHTGRRPTGYTVTFHYWAPSATSVEIQGEWSFARATNTPTASWWSTLRRGIRPHAWQPGDFPFAPDTWPVSRMKKNPRTGVWTFTTPLPSGLFTYGFYVNCPSRTGNGCTEVSDPANPPWNQTGNTVTGSVEPASEVYVPSDGRFGTQNLGWQAAARRRGRLAEVTYASPTHRHPAGQNYLAIYTPPGYNPHRASPYRTIYLSHGGGGNEVDWSTQGDLRNIMDNLIDDGQIEPAVVVMTNFNGFATNCQQGSWESAYDDDLINHVIPYVQAHYRVSAKAADRAFAGLSCGGDLAGTLLANDTGEFGYYGLFSPGANALPTLTAAQLTAMRGVSVFVGSGWQEPTSDDGGPGPRVIAAQDIATLTAGGVPLTVDLMNSGHDWYLWRILLHDWLARTAFWPTITTK